MRLNNAVIGGALILFALVMIAYTRTFPALPGQDYGPALFPTLIGIGMILTGLILVVGGLQRRGTEPLVDVGDWLREPANLACFVGVVLGLLAYILLADWLGFIPIALILLTGWLILFRRGKPISSAVIALAVTLVVYWAFTDLLLVPLPLGLLQSVVY